MVRGLFQANSIPAEADSLGLLPDLGKVATPPINLYLDYKNIRLLQIT